MTRRRASISRSHQSVTRKKLLIVTLSIIGLSLLAPVAAFASCPGRAENTSSYLYGWLRDAASGDHFDDIQATIEARNPNLPSNCSSNLCFSYAWDMLTNTTQSRWAQYGPMSGIWINHSPTTLIGAGADYTECYNASTFDQYDMYVTTTTVGSSPNYEIKGGDGSKRSFREQGVL